MISYNAKDLIEQASMLADLQNSDFISWKENVMFLDNAWNDMYQQIINHGDKSFLKEEHFSGSEWELPCDFYQLQYVTYNDGFYDIPINRKSKTATLDGPYYDIVENTLKIYNRCSTAHEIKVSYFPVRDSITYSAPEKELDFTDWNSDSYTFIDCCNKSILYTYKVDDVPYYGIYDIINGKNLVEKKTGNPVMIYSNGLVLDDTKPYYKVDNKAYYSLFDEENKTLTIYKINGTPFYTLTDVESFDAPESRVNTFTEDGIYYVTDDGKLMFFDFDTKKTEEYNDELEMVSKNVYGFKGNIYYEAREGVYCNDVIIYDASDYDTFRGVMKVDENTGYGILFDTFTLKSSYENTELLFPNNFYYNYMAYQMAIYYKIKQGADSTGVAGLAEQALKTFYDTLPRDGNEYVRISNAYAR